MLSNRAGEAAGVVKKDAPRSMLFAMRGEATVEMLEVGDLSAKGLPVVVLDHPALRALGGMAVRGMPGFGPDRPVLRGIGDFFGRPLDGIIGFTFFARYKTTIDYQARVLTFEPVDFPMRDLLKDLPDRLAGPKVARTPRPLARGGCSASRWRTRRVLTRLSAAGVTVVTVLPGSPAEAAGMKVGRRIARVDWTAGGRPRWPTRSPPRRRQPRRGGWSRRWSIRGTGRKSRLSVVPRGGI